MSTQLYNLRFTNSFTVFQEIYAISVAAKKTIPKHSIPILFNQNTIMIASRLDNPPFRGVDRNFRISGYRR